MTLWMDNRCGEDVTEETEALFRQVAEAVLQAEGFSLETEVSLSLVTPEEIRQINRQFRRIDRETDVLSFPQLTFAEGEEMEKNENGEILLGDIILSVARAKEQAESYGHSLKRELAFLTAHSMLHLLGYDHMTPEEETVMFQKQREILDGLGITR